MILYSFYNLYKLRNNQWLKLSELEEIQRRKLKRIIKHAYENVPYYRKLFDSVGVKPEDIRTVEDLAKIPITTRKQIERLRRDEIIAKGINLAKCEKRTTTGSSAMPLDVFFTKKDLSFLDMTWARVFLENGLRLRDKRASIKYHLPSKRWVQYLGIWRREFISTSDNSDDQIQSLKRINPDVLTGMPFNLCFLATAMKTKGIKGINPRLVFSMGALLDRESRKLLESVFRAKVFDYYGTEELGCIAWECGEHTGYHINMDTVVVEFVKDGKPVKSGERGKLICTGLHSYAMPFIKYEVGDVAIFINKQCPCGRGLALMKSIEGRTEDFIVNSKGKSHSPSVIIINVRVIRGVAQFKIIQESRGELAVQIVKGRDFSSETVHQVEQKLRGILGNEMHIKIEIVDEIPKDPSGKIRSVISKVPLEL
ncbi:MAG: phenylacetate--CoA ligase family protein [Candidatus Cloacimonadota bacterium]|nr:MAG: phenylacetate--CoA ligase family protein [Candidatus Cloacimonadota bacterium]